jgi:diketogulonate reductase-like aldo/keto reductase
MVNDININSHINNMPLVGLGTFRADDKAQLKQAVKHAIKVGYRHIDCGKGIVRVFFKRKTLKIIFFPR